MPKAARDLNWRASNDPYLLLDGVNGAIVDANRAAEGFWGHTLARIVGADARDLIDAEGAARIERAAGKEGRVAFRLRGVRIVQRSTATHSVDLSASEHEVADGRRLWLCRFRESGRRSAETELHRTNWALAAYARSASALIHGGNLEAQMLQACEAIVEQEPYALAVVGLKENTPEKSVRLVSAAGSAIGYAENLRLSWSDEAPEGRGATGRALRSGVPCLIQDTFSDPIFQFWKTLGVRFGLRSTVTVPFRKLGEVAGALLVYASQPNAFGPCELNLFAQLGEEIGFAMAIADGRRRLSAAMNAQRAAEQRVRALQAELARAERNAFIGEFAAALAHEINQPLAGVQINADAGLRWLERAAPDIDEAKGAIQRIVAGSQRMNEIVKRTRTMYLEEASEFRAFDLNEALREVIALIADRLKASSITVLFRPQRDLKPVLGDRVQLQQVMFNLVSNAADALETLADRPRRLRVRTRAADWGHALVEIEDNGPGFEPDAAERLFDRFYTTKTGGTGLGLSISRSIVQAHNGSISVGAADPAGSIFSFTVPLAPMGSLDD